MTAARFVFARLAYESGDWDIDERMPSNVLNSLIEYTTLSVDPVEQVVQLGSEAVFGYPFVYLTGHRSVRFTPTEKRNFERFVRNGGFVLIDDCNHDVDGAFARTVERELATMFTGAEALKKLPNSHPIYSAFFRFDKGPPTTSHELNGWGDNLVHDYLKGITLGGRLRVLYSNKDYGCEWDYDFRNKRFLREDNTKFGVNIVIYALAY